jgi:hypothetical protein
MVRTRPARCARSFSRISVRLRSTMAGCGRLKLRSSARCTVGFSPRRRRRHQAGLGHEQYPARTWSARAYGLFDDARGAMH